jgi:capsid protein
MTTQAKEGKEGTRKKPKKPLSLNKLREALETRLLENLLQDNWDSSADLWNRMRVPDDEPGWVPLSLPSDRKKGANYPIWRTEVELDRFRQQSRLLVKANDFAKGLLKNLTNSVIGKGYSYKAQTKEKIDAAPDEPGVQEPEQLTQLVAAVQNVVDEFLSINRWNTSTDPMADHQGPACSREREGFRRVRRDGEAFIRLFYLQDGRTKCRFVEPEQVRQPPGVTEQDGWSFGIRHNMEPFEDVEDVLEYHVVYQDPTTTAHKDTMLGELVPACEMVHVKNVDEDAATKRGLPDFVLDTLDALQRAAKLQRNSSIGAAIRAATAEIWQYATASQSQLTALAAGLKETERTDPITGRTELSERIRPGTVRRIPAGQTLVPPASATGVPEHQQAVQGDLRQASSGFCAPEYMTGDASNGNYASTREAGTPFVRAGECDQEHFKGAYLICVWRAVRHAVECGRLPPEALTLVVIQVEAPTVVTRDDLQRAQEDQILIPLGVKDRQTAAMERGLDHELVQANNEEYQDRMGGQGNPLPMPDDDPGNPSPPQFESREIRRLRRQVRRLQEAFDEGKIKRDGGKFSSTGGGSGPDVHADAEHALAKPSLVAKMKALPGKVASKAKQAVANIYNKAEKKYGPRWAKAIVATAIITAPTPVTLLSVAAMTGLAHVWTKYHGTQNPGKVKESAEHAMSDEEILAAAKEFLKTILAAMPKE